LTGWSARGAEFEPLVLPGAMNVAATTAEANNRRVVMATLTWLALAVAIMSGAL
jgi:hypothetical protein